LVVADIRLHREALAGMLTGEHDIEVVGSADCVEDIEDRVATLHPDVVILDLGSVEGAGLWAHRIAVAGHRPSLVALGVSDTEGDMMAWAEAGVSGYIPPDAGRGEMVRTLRGVAQGEAVYPPRFVAALFRHVASRAGNGVGHDARVTAREREILELMRHGRSNKEIAESLVISIATVKNHVHNILEKLGATRRQDAVARWQGVGPGTQSRTPQED
jgi:two-component system nitrate/nitrite response regulator NarL